MTTTVTIEEAQLRLKELLAGLGPGEEVLIVENSRPVAQLRRSEPQAKARQAGACAGMVLEYIDDEDHLEDFRDYMP